MTALGYLCVIALFLLVAGAVLALPLAAVAEWWRAREARKWLEWIEDDPSMSDDEVAEQIFGQRLAARWRK